MHTLHLTGFPRLTYEGQAVDCSRKGLALLCFLVLERDKPHSRETLTSLLWDAPHATSQRNLRVELSKLRASGLSLPSHELSVEVLSTDLIGLESLWLESEAQVLEALKSVLDKPLTGLAEVGTAAFREWVEGWQTVLCGTLETVLQRWYGLADTQNWKVAKKAVLEKACALNLRLRTDSLYLGSPALGTLHFPRPELEQALLSALETAQSRPLLVSLCGPAGSGKSYLAHWLSRQPRNPALLTLSVTCASSSRLTLALLAAELLPHLRGPARESVQAVRSGLRELDSDLLRLSTVLEDLGRPLLLIFEQAQAAAPDLLNLLEFWLSTLPSGLLLMLSREDSIPSEITRNLRCSLTLGTRPELRELHLGSLGLESVQQGLRLLEHPNLEHPNLEHPELEHPEAETRAPADEALLAHANQLLQRSDGNVQHLLTLLEEERNTLLGTGPSPQIQHIYLGEVRHWPETLYQALRYLSALHTTFDEARATALLGRMNLEQPGRLLSSALERGVLHPARPERALVFPYWTPLEDAPAGEERFEFGRETLRIALATTLPQPLRQELRRHLVELLEGEDPGLASYYAQRTGQLERAKALLTLHRQRLAVGSPLSGGVPEQRSWGHLSSPPPPPRRPGPGPSRRLREQGYEVALESGWLSVRRRGRYGHADTLRLLFTLPTPAFLEPRAGELKLTWRLDVFKGGYDMWPSKVPFPLRLRLLSRGQSHNKPGEQREQKEQGQHAHLLSPEQLESFFDEGLEQRVHPDVKLDGWMEHCLDMGQPCEGALLELSVRALDVALVLGSLEWNGQNLLSVDTAQRETVSVKKTFLR